MISFVPEEVDRYSLFPLIHPEQIDTEEDFCAIEHLDINVVFTHTHAMISYADEYLRRLFDEVSMSECWNKLIRLRKDEVS
jgi:hypothetical protein